MHYPSVPANSLAGTQGILITDETGYRYAAHRGTQIKKALFPVICEPRSGICVHLRFPKTANSPGNFDVSHRSGDAYKNCGGAISRPDPKIMSRGKSC